jgi:hypothetical protein
MLAALIAPPAFGPVFFLLAKLVVDLVNIASKLLKNTCRNCTKVLVVCGMISP